MFTNEKAAQHNTTQLTRAVMKMRAALGGYIVAKGVVESSGVRQHSL